MLSEYEQNLIKEIEGPTGLVGRRGRKWSLARGGSALLEGGGGGERRRSSLLLPPALLAFRPELQVF